MIKTIIKSTKSAHIRKVLFRALLYSAAIIIPLMTPLFIVFFSEDISKTKHEDMQVDVIRDAMEEDLDEFMPRKILRIGMHIDDLANIQPAEQTFESRFVFWAKNYFDRSANDRSKMDVGQIDIINSNELELEEKTIRYIDEDTEEFISYISHAGKGSLKNNFFLSDYPFDKHTLKFIFEPKDLTADEMLLTIDPDSTLSAQDSLGAWEVREFKGTSGVHVAKSDYSDPETIKKGALWTSIPQAKFEVTVERNIFSHLIKELFPLLLVVIILYMNLFVSSSMYEIRTETAITCFLTITALHWVASEELGNVPYLTAMDQFFLVSYGLVLLVTLEALISRDLLPDEEEPDLVEEAMRNPWFKMVIPGLRIIFPLFLVGSWYWIAFTANT